MFQKCKEIYEKNGIDSLSTSFKSSAFPNREIRVFQKVKHNGKTGGSITISYYQETYYLKNHTNFVTDTNQLRNISMNFLRSNKLPSVYIECLSFQFRGVL